MALIMVKAEARVELNPKQAGEGVLVSILWPVPFG